MKTTPSEKMARLDERSQRVGVWLLRHREGIAYLLLIAVALGMRLWDLGSRAYHHDESLHVYYSWILANKGDYLHDPMMHGPVQFFGNAFIFRVFGDSDFTGRLFYALMGTGLVGLPYFLRGYLGRAGAFITAALLAFSPTMLYFSRFARNDILMAVWAVGLVALSWRYMKEQRPRYLYGIAALLALAFSTKETVYILVGLLAFFFFLVSLGDILRWLRGRLPFSQFTPAGGLFILFATLSLPQWSALIGRIQDRLGLVLTNPEYLKGPVGTPIGQTGLLVAAGVVVALLSIGVVVGVMWKGRTWLICAGIFYGIWILLYTTFFTNLVGIGSGMWQSLGYWVVQQDVARGNQPWYYYFVMGWNYEFLAFAFAVVGALFFLRRGGLFERFLIYWAVFNFLAYTMAAEKMPWLAVNVTLPLILLAGRFLGELVQRVSWWEMARRGGVLLMALVPIAATLLVWMLLLVVRRPDFPSYALFWLALMGLLAILGLAFWLSRGLARGHVAGVVALGLAVAMVPLTVFSAGRAAYVNGDVPVEMLVYTQTSPQIPDIMDEMDALARQRGIQKEQLRVWVDATDGYAWPWAWYLRRFKAVAYPDLSRAPLQRPPDADVVLLADRNRSQEDPYLKDFALLGRYRLRWWHPETYRNLTPSGIGSALVRRSGWQGPLDYFFSRRLGTGLGSSDALAYFPPDATPTHNFLTP